MNDQNLQNGVEAHRRGNHETAHLEFLRAAEQGNVYAQFNLGVLYANGEGVQKNNAKSVYWFFESAKQGYMYAQSNLGTMYANGEGVSRDYIKAYKWFSLASAQELESAATDLDRLRQRMTFSQIAQAQAQTRKWISGSGSNAPGGGAKRRSVAPRGIAPWVSSASPDSTGSGFFVSAEHILTNAHVIAGYFRLRISPNGDDAIVYALDRANDLALLQISAGSSAQPTLLRRRDARLGETVVVAGYPLHGLVGDGLNVTRGEVSALSGIGGDSRRLQITAPVQKGNSGGPLLDKSGHVLGVVDGKLNSFLTARITGDIPQNVNFAIRAEFVRNFLDSHNVPYQIAPAATARSTEQIADEARAHTVLIECWK